MDRDDKEIVIEIVLWPLKAALHALLMATGWFQESTECPHCSKNGGHNAKDTKP